MDKLEKAILEGLTFLKQEQEEDGSFLSLSSFDPVNFKNASFRHLTFSTALIFLCLKNLEGNNNAVQSIVEKGLEFFLSQKSPYWTFNYWVRDSLEYKEMPYPEDLDDTFCILAALWNFSPKLIDGEVMAKIVTVLTSLEVSEGGPYRTWLVPEMADSIWKDADLVVNTNILYFFKLQGIELPKVEKFIDKSIKSGAFTSPYYYGSLPLIYFLSRFYDRKKLEKAKSFLLKTKNLNPLEAALKVTSLLNLGVSPKVIEEDVRYLLSVQKDGRWEAYPLVTEVLKNIGKCFSGSQSLTTAFCLEALNKYKIIKKQKDYNFDKFFLKQEKISLQVMKKIKEELSAHDKPFQKKAFYLIKLILDRDSHTQIMLVPYLFKESLGKNGRRIPQDLVVNLGLANLFGWISYGLYDDFFDGEGDPKLLSFANFALREFTFIASNILPKNSGFTNFFQKIMNKIDNANYWEIENCRLKIERGTIIFTKDDLLAWNNYKKLAERSLGHALGPVAILYLLGFNDQSKEVKNLLNFFIHYLIAKQLNDDAHDFENDFKKGILSPVVSLLLQNILLREEIVAKDVKVKETIPIIQETFWSETIDIVCKDILKHTKLAKKSLLKVSVVADPTLFENLLLPLEHSAQKAMLEKKETVKFLNTYQGLV